MPRDRQPRRRLRPVETSVPLALRQRRRAGLHRLAADHDAARAPALLGNHEGVALLATLLAALLATLLATLLGTREETDACLLR